MNLRELATLLDLLATQDPAGAKTVLVVEDYQPLLERMSHYWEEQGHRVIGLLGVDIIEGDLALGTGMSGPVNFRLSEVDAACLDFYFLSRGHNGKTLTLALRAAGSAKILGMSSVPDANRSMVAAGANEGIKKSEILPLFGL